jgi:hypothetical protein
LQAELSLVYKSFSLIVLCQGGKVEYAGFRIFCVLSRCDSHYTTESLGIKKNTSELRLGILIQGVE